MLTGFIDMFMDLNEFLVSSLQRPRVTQKFAKVTYYLYYFNVLDIIDFYSEIYNVFIYLPLMSGKFLCC